MKRVFILGFIAGFSLLNAVTFIPASGVNVASSRDSLVYYHNNTDDQHWYGTDSWAVKFDFNYYFPSIDSIQFQAEGARVYIPGDQSLDSMTVKLCKNDVNQPNLNPDSILFAYTIQPSEMNFHDWNDIDFIQNFTDTIFWLVVDYPTNPTTQFISASANDGSHSYFEDDGYYYNMLANSFESEFLFSLKGRFITEGDDLDLICLDWIGGMAPGGLISPRFIIKNNSDVTVENSYIDINLIYPEGEINLLYISSGSVCDSINLPPLPADETIIFDVSDSLRFHLVRRPAQYEVYAELFCESDSLTENNTFESSFNVFNISQSRIMIENVVKLNNSGSEGIWEDQSLVLVPETSQVINYFANFPDVPFFNEYSLERYHYYDLMGFPATIIGGNKKILGYNSQSYASILDSLFSISLGTKTFINSDTSYAFYDESGNVEFSIELVNEETYLFNEFVSDCKLYIAVVENILNYQGLPPDIEIPVMLYMIDVISDLQLSCDSTFCDTVGFNMNEDFQPITSDLDNCVVVYWLQNDDTKEIFLVGSLPFTEFNPGLVDITQENIPHFSQTIQIYPNPFSLNGNLKICFNSSRNIQFSELKIFNIKGQLVKTITNDEESRNCTFLWDGRDKNAKEVSSGVYLLKLKAETDGKINTHFRKCLLIKQK